MKAPLRYRMASEDPVKHRPIAERIRAAWRHRIGYHELLSKVFPPDEYPRAYNRPAGGGPPGCSRPFGKALRLLGLQRGPQDIILGSPDPAPTKTT